MHGSVWQGRQAGYCIVLMSIMSINFAVNQLGDSLARQKRWLILRFNWYKEPAALAAADNFFEWSAFYTSNGRADQ